MYQALYRKYRPQTFSDVSGQEHVTVTLKNQLQDGRLSHAYLFTGSRGTGKTSCAKILAKAVNCLNLQNGDPCNSCENCVGIDNGSILDVVEIDAASNNGVENIRDLREKVQYTPAKAKYRVYIIDEVHMLSTGAFNALLKTLEEPPPHVIFILATTEVHKLPATILSRCQRYDFSRISPSVITERLKFVSDNEGITLDDDAAMLIARLADGGMRDALSLLDLCAGEKNITEKTVEFAAGLTGHDHLFEIVSCIHAGNTGNIIEILDNLHKASSDMERLCNDLISHFRNLMLIKTVKSADSLIVCTSDELKQLKSQAGDCKLPVIIHSLELLEKCLESMKKGADRKTELEMTLIKLCIPELDTTAEAILRRVSAIEESLKTGVKISKPDEEPLEEVEKSETEEVPEPSNNQNNITEFKSWPEALDLIKNKSKVIHAALNGSKAYIKGDYFLIDSESTKFRDIMKSDNQNKEIIRDAVKSVTGRKYKLGPFIKEEQKEIKEDPLNGFVDTLKEFGLQ